MLDQAALVGLASSIVTEICKFAPFVRDNPIVRSITAIIVVLIGSVISAQANGQTLTMQLFVTSLVFSLTAYRTIVEPVADSASLKSQA